MKSILLKTLTIFAGALLILGCTEDKKLDNTKVTAVQNLYTPEADTYIELKKSESATTLFEWEKANAEDGGMVMYEVAFDKPDGDFSDPVYTMTSDNNGVHNRATISHQTLNKIGGLADIKRSETGTLKWTVYSSKGINEVKAEEAREIEVKRLAGFANVPTNVFITGEATETGTNLSDARKMKSGDPGKFEIYTELTSGESYHFVNSKSGDPRKFYIDGESLKEGEEGSTVESTGVYRIELNFTVGSVVMTEIKKLEFYFSFPDEFSFELPYQGNGVFKADDIEMTFPDAPWGSDTRYKYRMTVDDGSGESYEWWGNDEVDVGQPNNESPDSYYYIYPTGSAQWDNIFKLHPDMNQSIIDVMVYFQAGKEHYTQEVVKEGDLK